MPVYLCKPGVSTAEPWRHGVQVYHYPFRIDGDNNANDTTTTPHAPTSSLPTLSRSLSRRTPQRQPPPSPTQRQSPPTDVTHDDETIHHSNQIDADGTASASGVPIRRIRHAEVVLVDEVSVQYGRYWLRLRWPGAEGGFAGYIALGSVVETAGPTSSDTRREVARRWLLERAGEDDVCHVIPSRETSTSPGRQSPRDLSPHELEELEDDADADAEPPEEEGEDVALPSLLPPRCASTGLFYPSSSAMELLTNYDDGLAGMSGENGVGHGLRISLGGNDDLGEPVFCRICREGLHDVNYDMDRTTLPPSPPQPTTSSPANPTTTPTPQSQLTQNATHHPTAENPLLAPCECSGSIAFVHYLCVEQWRCRSRHPAAMNGLNCETCGKPYTLPPPPSRPIVANEGVFAEDDWLEAMPAHVLAALRRPHPWWQMGAAVVRRKWLRPIAPIVISPIVALYCRARRLLKKRGVSRRRWACSLCRRRARWKCVRCLRSYYCSRQCQNVSWHIVHKHVCYKRARFTWSCVVYGVGGVLCFPGVWKDPLIYATGALLVPTNFFIVGVLGGATASLMKKTVKIDMRGRSLEASVVIATLFMTLLSWNIIWGFFGQPEKCTGVTPSVLYPSTLPYLSEGFSAIHSVISFVNRTIEKVSPLSLEMRGTNPMFLLEEEGEMCARDVTMLLPLWLLAGVLLLGGSIFKKRDRERRGRGAAGRGRAMIAGERHAHQD